MPRKRIKELRWLNYQPANYPLCLCTSIQFDLQQIWSIIRRFMAKPIASRRYHFTDDSDCLTYCLRKIKKANINEIVKMSGTMFERFLEQSFKRQGWQVNRTGGKGEYGAYLVLSSATKNVFIQAKRWKKNIGYESIKQACTSEDVYGCVETWIIPIADLQYKLKKALKRLRVKLLDREVLIEEITNVNAAQTVVVQEPEHVDVRSTVALIPDHKQENVLFVCARCGKLVTNKLRTMPFQFEETEEANYCNDHQRTSTK